MAALRSEWLLPPPPCCCMGGMRRVPSSAANASAASSSNRLPSLPMLRDDEDAEYLLLLNAGPPLGGDTEGDAKGEIPPPSSLVGGLLVLVVAASSAAEPTTEDGAVEVASEDSEGLDDGDSEEDHGSLGRMFEGEGGRGSSVVAMKPLASLRVVRIANVVRRLGRSQASELPLYVCSVPAPGSGRRTAGCCWKMQSNSSQQPVAEDVNLHVPPLRFRTAFLPVHGSCASCEFLPTCSQPSLPYSDDLGTFCICIMGEFVHQTRCQPSPQTRARAASPTCALRTTSIARRSWRQSRRRAQLDSYTEACVVIRNVLAIHLGCLN